MAQKDINKLLNKYVDVKYDSWHYYMFKNHRKAPNPIVEHFKTLFNKDKEDAWTKMFDFVQQSKFIDLDFILFAESNLDEDQTYQIYLEILKKDSRFFKEEKHWVKVGDRDYQPLSFFEKVFQSLDKYDKIDTTSLLKSAVKISNPEQDVAIKLIQKHIVDAEEEAVKMLNGKNKKSRILAAKVLAASSNQETIDLLKSIIDTETNDEIRNTLIEQFTTDHISFEELSRLISNADQRGKLNWNEKHIEEQNMPILYWKNGNPLSNKEVRFLMYRNAQSKGLETDLECNYILQHIDLERSSDIVDTLLAGFTASEFDTKLKYYLTLVGKFGGDETLQTLNTLMLKALNDSRYKLAEYYVAPMANIGTNKALRMLDMYTRKYASKKKNIGRAAAAALEVAAVEMNITRDQLADRIIPHFDFEDGYKTFQVGDEEYRAFINDEFKLNFFNPDNKLRKSIPKETDKATKDEFKQIQKTIREVVKAQKGRLQIFLINERKWDIDEWMEFYFQNPIMLVYVQRIYWGLYDDNNNLKTVFYCDEDLSFYDVNDDEVELENGKIGIVHPIQMDENLLQQWKDKTYDLDIETDFQQFGRPIYYPTSEQLKLKEIKYESLDIPRGADGVASFLTKRGWEKVPSDAGTLDFYKYTYDRKHYVIANIYGPMAYYMGGNEPASLEYLSFYSKGWNKATINKFSTLFFSELMLDIELLLK